MGSDADPAMPAWRGSFPPPARLCCRHVVPFLQARKNAAARGLGSAAAWDRWMTDPRMKPQANPMPFNGKRMIYGGFEPIIER